MRLTQKSQRVLFHGLFILVLLLALSLRLFRIEAQSLWNDEGTSVSLATRDLVAITRGAANDIHPPLYYYVLHFWMGALGDSELAVRSLSALLGAALVLLTFTLGRSFAGNATGLIAALFAAISPFQIYYSQETRMYILTALLGALSVLAWMRLMVCWQSANRGGAESPFRVALYVIVTILLLYTHYFAATLIIMQNFAFLWWLEINRLSLVGRRLLIALRWAAIQAITVAAYLPWLFLVREQLRMWPAISKPMPITTLLVDLLRVFSLGLSAQTCSNMVLAGFAGLLFLGLLPSRPHQRVKLQRQIRSISYVLFVLYLFVPICAMYVLSLRRPMYNPKFLLLCTIPFHLFLAHGVCWLADKSGCFRQFAMATTIVIDRQGTRTWSWLRCILPLAAIAFVVGTSFYSLRAYYFDPRYARDDYRSIAQYIEAVEKEGDAVLLNAPGQIETFTYYYQGKLPLYPLPRQRPLDKAQAEAELAQMIQGRKCVFAILWATAESDPERFVEGWLDQHCYKAIDAWYGNVRFVVYAVPTRPAEPRMEHPLQVHLGDKVCLLGYNLLTQEVRPGDILQLSLFWQAVAPIKERYKVFTHVVDAYGHLVGQRDAEPGGGAKITTIWQEGEQVIDNYGLLILPATPPGDYVIEVGMYGLEDGQRLPVIEHGQVVGDHVILQSVHVLPAMTPPPLSVLGRIKQMNVRFDDITFLGYDLAKLGYEHQPDASVHPGDILHLTLFWQANRQPFANIMLHLQLQDEHGAVWVERWAQPTEGLYPAQQWNAGEIVRDQHNLFLPADLPPQRYRICLAVQRLPNGPQLGPSLMLTHLTIE